MMTVRGILLSFIEGILLTIVINAAQSGHPFVALAVGVALLMLVYSDGRSGWSV